MFFSLTKQERQTVPMDTKWSPRGHGLTTPGSVPNVYFKIIDFTYIWQERKSTPPPSLHQNYLNLAGLGGIEY